MLALLSVSTSRKLAEAGFLLLLIAGLWLVSSELPIFRATRARGIVAGCALAASGVLLLIATHWGHFG
jgi:hypothetical protein